TRSEVAFSCRPDCAVGFKGIENLRWEFRLLSRAAACRTGGGRTDHRERPHTAQEDREGSPVGQRAAAETEFGRAQEGPEDRHTGDGRGQYEAGRRKLRCASRGSPPEESRGGEARGTDSARGYEHRNADRGRSGKVAGAGQQANDRGIGSELSLCRFKHACVGTAVGNPGLRSRKNPSQRRKWVWQVDVDRFDLRQEGADRRL